MSHPFWHGFHSELLHDDENNGCHPPHRILGSDNQDVVNMHRSNFPAKNTHDESMANMETRVDDGVGGHSNGDHQSGVEEEAVVVHGHYRNFHRRMVHHAGSCSWDRYASVDHSVGHWVCSDGNYGRKNGIPNRRIRQQEVGGTYRDCHVHGSMHVRVGLYWRNTIHRVVSCCSYAYVVAKSTVELILLVG